MNKGITYLITAILWGGAGALSAGNPPAGISMLDFKIDRESVIGKGIRDYYTSGPVAKLYVDSSTISTARLTADIEKFDTPIMIQNGDGHNIYGLSAESYYKLSNVSTVWGQAGYHNGKTRNVSFSDVVDYEMVAPFVIGDDTGGDLSSQQYDFGGGWGHSFGQWLIGLQADYTAAIYHRAVDPRVRNVVSDLNVAIGGGHMIGVNYMIGLNLGVKIYHLNSDVDLYNPVSHAITMLYTGLGNTSSRFKGADAQSSTHRLTGFNASLQFVPTTHSDRFYVVLSGKKTNVDMILDGYNNLNFGSTSTTIVDGSVSRLITSGQFSLLPTISGRYTDRIATENLFGSSAGNYEKIGERKNYHHNVYGVAIGIPVSWRLAHQTLLSLALCFDYNKDNEYLIEPARSLATDYFTDGVKIDANKKFGRQWAVGLRIGYNGRFISSTTANWTALDLTSPEGKMTMHNYNMSSCNVNAFDARLEVSRSIKSMILSLSAQYDRYDYKDQNNGNRILTSISLSF